MVFEYRTRQLEGRGCPSVTEVRCIEVKADQAAPERAAPAPGGSKSFDWRPATEADLALEANS